MLSFNRAKAVFLSLALAACGGSAEDFSVDVKRPAAAVLAPFAAIDVGPMRALFPGIAVHRSRPSDDTVLYTIPGGDGVESTILLRFESLDGGARTAIHATVDVPPVRAMIDGVDKQLSEAKVERLLKAHIQAAATELEMGGSGEGHTQESLATLFAGIAVASDKRHLDRALAMKDDPAGLLAALAGFADFDESADAPADRVQDNPDLAGLEDEAAGMRRDWQAQDAMESAAGAADDAEPMDDADAAE